MAKFDHRRADFLDYCVQKLNEELENDPIGSNELVEIVMARFRDWAIGYEEEAGQAVSFSGLELKGAMKEIIDRFERQGI